MRALDRGYRVVVDDGLYVYHHGSGTVTTTGRNENMERNKALFMERWGTRYEALEQQWQKQNPIPYMDKAVLDKENKPRRVKVGDKVCRLIKGEDERGH